MGLLNTITDCITLNKPLLIVGPSGSGKSVIIHQAAESLDMGVVDLRPSQLDPVDVRGMPIINRDKDGCGAGVAWATPDFIIKVREILKQKGKKGVVLLIDEITCAAPAVQNALLQLILDRRVGPHELPDACYIIAACNKAEHGAYATPLSAPLRNRFIIVDHEPTVDEWTQWAFANNIEESVIGFIQWRPQALYNLTQNDYEPFATPRSWETVSDLIKTVCQDGANTEYLAGAVGKGAAGELRAYVDEIQHMPDLNKLIKGELTYTHDPAKPSITYAITVGLLYKVTKNVKLLDNAAEIMAALGPEFESVFFSNLIQGSDPEQLGDMLVNKSVRTWSSKNGYKPSTALVF